MKAIEIAFLDAKGMKHSFNIVVPESKEELKLQLHADDVLDFCLLGIKTSYQRRVLELLDEGNSPEFILKTMQSAEWTPYRPSKSNELLDQYMKLDDEDKKDFEALLLEVKTKSQIT